MAIMDFIDAKQTKALYTLAYNAYEEGRYKEAIHLFKILTLCEAHLQKHWIGLAACHQMLTDYNEALKAYMVAAMIDDSLPEIHMHAAECLFALGQREDAEKAIHSAEQLSKTNSPLFAELALIKEKWNNKLLN